MRTPLIDRLNFFRRNESGAVAVEFALIAPLLFGLLFGIITLGYFIGINHSVNQLAAGAARASVTGLNQTERSALANNYLSEAGSRYPLLTPASVSPTVVFEGGNPEGITVTVAYAVDGSMLGIANNLLGLDITSINGSAYLAY
ncbi:TadE-like protein [Sulfitobacter noctilucicola]|uniref:Flp pilus assembly protein TadG n=1 Tax=Sulfitobacter noctilucicola TaxID=1342301 RepID=A0A7W6M648_9RHOB|nr:TadE/TadG family type IV pilus assembly protein [Sulfitobacter noctilucicola]KIN62664.1 TadE-like protein [Sulfitobacter noctilucicola]MBB4172803.1 Flp pilus assembly protein TadG [Sulfitobacter noctilucicola]